MNTNNIDMILIQKMVFIYNAVLSGWTVNQIDNNNFEFTKSKNNIKKEVNLNSYLEKFISYNINIDNLKDY
jgi:hypothetical protein